MFLRSKRFIAAMLTFIIAATTLSALPITVAADETTGTTTKTSDKEYHTLILLDDDFEDRPIGEQIPALGSTHSRGTKTEWNINPAIVVEEEITGNKVAKLYSEEGGTLTMQKVNRYGECDLFNLSIKARVKPVAGTSILRWRNYSAPKQTIDIKIASGALTCFGSVVGNIDMSKWTDIEFRIDAKNNRGQVLINDVIVADKENLINEGVTYGYGIVECISTVAAGGSAYWDDIFVREMGSIDYETGKENENNLAKLDGVHPRLFATAEDFENMKRVAAGELSEEYAAFIKDADRLEQTPPTEYYYVSSKEELWMEEVGYSIMKLSLAYKLTGDKKYLTAARNWAIMGTTYPQWGRDSAENHDLAAAHMLVATSCFYDWCYDDISAADKQTILNCLIERGTAMSKGSWYNSNYLQNHLWISRSGLYAAAAAIYDVYEPAVEWFGITDLSYKSIFKYLGAENSDGSSHEGFGYYLFGLTFVSFYLELAEDFMNVDYKDHAHLKNAYKYVSNMMMPNTYDGSKEVSVFSYGDATMGQNVLVFSDIAQLASYTRGGGNQWLVNSMRDQINDDSGNQQLWRMLLWYDETLNETPFEEQGRTNDEYLEHLGFFFSRTGWTDDASIVAYRCGPLFGKEAATDPPSYSLGTGHNHGDLNSPWIWTRGENLISESGYGNQETAAHSTLLVNGTGQVRTQPATPLLPDILKIDSQDNLTYSVGDATDGYDDTLGLEKFHRHFIYLKPDILIMVDDIQTKEGDTPIPLELKFFPNTVGYTAELDGSYSFEAKNTSFNINPADMQEGVVSACGSINKGNTTGVGISITTSNSKVVQPTIFSWTDKGKEPVKVDVVRKNDSRLLEFYTNRDKIVLDLDTMTVTHEVIKTGDTAIKLNGVLVEGDYLATLGSDYRFYMEADELAEILKVNCEVDGKTVKLSSTGGATVSMSAGSKIVNMGGKELEMDATPYILADNIMVPVKYAAQGFGIGVEYNESDKVLAFRNGADFTNADLRSIAANGIGIQVEEGVFDYGIETFGSEAQISAIAVDSSTRIEITNGGMDNVSTIKTISADGTNSNTYTVSVKAIHGIGNVGIYQMSYSDSDGNVGENAFDKDLDSRWAAEGIGQWIFMDLGKKVKLDHMLVAYVNGAKRKEYFDIQVSEDGENWETIGQFNSSGTTKEPEKYPMNGVETRYVRFWSRGQGQGGWTSVGEIGLVKAE